MNATCQKGRSSTKVCIDECRSRRGVLPPRASSHSARTRGSISDNSTHLLISPRGVRTFEENKLGAEPEVHLSEPILGDDAGRHVVNGLTVWSGTITGGVRRTPTVPGGNDLPSRSSDLLDFNTSYWHQVTNNFPLKRSLRYNELGWRHRRLHCRVGRFASPWPKSPAQMVLDDIAEGGFVRTKARLDSQRHRAHSAHDYKQRRNARVRHVRRRRSRVPGRPVGVKI